VELHPDFAEGHNNLGLLLSQIGQKDEAIVHLHRAVELHPDSAETHNNLGRVLVEKGELDGAIAHLERALAIEPNFVEAHFNLGNALLQKGQTGGAILCYQWVLGIQPTNAVLLNNLAWIRAAHPQAEFRDGAEAVRLAEKACRLTGYQEAVMVGTLAAAYAEAGRFEEAVATAEKARELALALGQEKLAEKNRELIPLYRARQPYREPAGPAEHEKP
jgi:tetratricopeptide (TPR) repeat protein